MNETAITSKESPNFFLVVSRCPFVRTTSGSRDDAVIATSTQIQQRLTYPFLYQLKCGQAAYIING